MKSFSFNSRSLEKQRQYGTLFPMSSLLPIIQIVLAALLIGGVLLQRSDAGLGSAFGQDTFGGVKYEKRGMEKTVFVLTIAVAILFALSAIAGLFVR